MQFKNSQRFSKEVVDYQPAHPLSGTPYHYDGDTLSFSELVEPGPMISGNKKDPNNWYYSVKRRSTPLGVSTRTYGESWSIGTDPPIYYSGYGKITVTAVSPLTLDDPDASSEELKSFAEEDAYNKFIEKCRGSVDLSIDLFQARKTAEMMNAFDRFEGAFKRVPGIPRKLAIAKQLGGKWLEWVYGWSPLLSTIYGTAEEMIRYNINRTVVVKGRRHLIRHSTPKVNSATWNGPLSHELKVYSFAKSQYVVELRVVDNDLSRLTSLNPASIAWELLPFSFVADWFLDIGSYIRGLETQVLYGDRFVRGYQTTLHGDRTSASISRTEDLGAGEVSTDSYSADGFNIFFNRTILDSFPLPKGPKLRLELSSGRMLNAAALVSQFLKH